MWHVTRNVVDLYNIGIPSKRRVTISLNIEMIWFGSIIQNDEKLKFLCEYVSLKVIRFAK